MVATQIILLSWWFNKKNPMKKTNKKDPIKMVRSKLICPKWHFGQVEHWGKKNHMGGFLDQNCESNKLGFLIMMVLSNFQIEGICFHLAVTLGVGFHLQNSHQISDWSSIICSIVFFITNECETLVPHKHKM